MRWLLRKLRCALGKHEWRAMYAPTITFIHVTGYCCRHCDAERES
jgi:hypothetical protein